MNTILIGSILLLLPLIGTLLYLHRQLDKEEE